WCHSDSPAGGSHYWGVSLCGCNRRNSLIVASFSLWPDWVGQAICPSGNPDVHHYQRDVEPRTPLGLGYYWCVCFCCFGTLWGQVLIFRSRGILATLHHVDDLCRWTCQGAGG